MTTSLVIPRRFRGPPRSVNGGYACGISAVGLPRAVVTLRKPVPYDTPLALADGVLRSGDEVVAEAVVGDVDGDLPAAVSFAEATAASERYVGFDQHPYPECFVCGPARAAGDGMRLFPGSVGGRVAAPFVPDGSICDGGELRPEQVWAALDCPTYFGAMSAAGLPPPWEMRHHTICVRTFLRGVADANGRGISSRRRPAQ